MGTARLLFSASAVQLAVALDAAPTNRAREQCLHHFQVCPVEMPFLPAALFPWRQLHKSHREDTDAPAAWGPAAL